MPQSSLGISKTSIGIDENYQVDDSRHKLDKKVKKIRQKSSFRSIENQERMAGGADEKEDEVESKTGRTSPESASSTTSHEKSAPAGGDGKVTTSGGPCCFCASFSSGSTGDKKVDDMIDYVVQNLQEAGKALTNLGENFEHDLKLMFVDIMARVQHWVSIVQNRLDAAKSDLEALRKELIARACDLAAKERELAELKAQLSECEANKIACEKSLKEALQQRSVHLNGPQQTSIQTQQQDYTDTNTVTPATQVSVAPPPSLVSFDPTQSSIPPGTTNSHIISYTPGGTTEAPDQVPGESPVSLGTVCQLGKEQAKAKRESELEAELARLRKENERIMKERAEYENAIQRALLRGVSSLNVEALKVLRCPPIPCCTPCGPCQMSSANEYTDPTVPCTPRNIKNNSTSVTHKAANAMPRSGNANGRKNGVHSICTTQTQGYSPMQRPCKSACTSSARSKNVPENNMVFLLHEADVGNICTSNSPTVSRTCDRSSEKNVVCTGGKCGRSMGSSTKDKFSCVSKTCEKRTSSVPARHKSETNTVSCKKPGRNGIPRVDDF
ncbi:uncharacterized protein LOC107269829 isoform X2 [Cephus cinctus]|uniref:Uncharacterized protein LOC107269829 isoform X2 n=1 Tax=Cephus cinctus TaxID=211228 RepID=A0AAJ7RM62_CEPCN|nr:uncharacterized protein LOC107269829 isoform X2 [Cephus cinctus]